MRSALSAWSRISTTEKWILSILTCLIVFGYLFNLGLFPLTADEGIRSTVAIEMMLSDNFVVPTIGGEFYYRKTPLYNWIIAGFFGLTGSFSEFVFRLPSVLPLFLFGVTIWSFGKKHIGNRAALIAGFSFILCGRILVYASLLGHIDIFFSWLTFIGIYSVHHYFKKEKWWALFIIFYLVSAIGVLMKGLPSILFLGITLLTWFLYKRSFKRLFHPAHFAALGMFTLIVGGYFYLYSNYTEVQPFFEALFKQSSQRTLLEKSWWETIANLFLFPLENWVHLLPTSLIFIFAFRRGMIRRWMNNDFLAFSLIVLAANLVPYWLSPGTYPRYLFMLYPMALILGAEALTTHKDTSKVLSAIFDWIFGIGGVILFGVFIAVLFLEEMDIIEHSAFWAIGLAICTLLTLFTYKRLPRFRVFLAFIMIALFRIGFDVFILPHRVYTDNSGAVMQRNHCAEIARITSGSKVYKLNKTPLNEENNFYLSAAKREIIRRQDTMKEPDAFYIAHPRYLDHVEFELVYKFNIKWDKTELWLVKPR